LATTYSRSAAISLALFVVIVLVGGRREPWAWLLCGAVAAGFLFGSVAFDSGWKTKGEVSTSTTTVDTGRVERAKEALRLFDRQPIVGVGPGRYVIELESIDHVDSLPAHNVVLHALAEAGIVAAVLTAALLTLLGVRALQTGWATLAVFAVPVLFFLLDAYPYIFPTGLAVTGLWLGLILTPDREPSVV
jgi:O-antigen ligase